MNRFDWDKLVEELGPRLFKYFSVRFSNEQADDLTQETLIRLVRKVKDGKFDPEKGTMSMLGFGIAHYVALESKKFEPNEQIEDWNETLTSDVDFEHAALNKDAAVKIREKMKQLSSIELEIMSFLVDEDLTLGQISSILQIPEGTVKSHVFRAKKKLVTLLNKDDFL